MIPFDEEGRQIISRQEALAIGARFYFTGNPCPQGHYSERYTGGGNLGKCVACFKAKQKRYFKTYRPAYYEKNKARFKQWSAENHQRNRAERIKSATDWRKRNPDRSRTSVIKWREANRELFRAVCREWARNNKAKRHAHRAMRLMAEGTFTQDDISEMMQKQRGRCAMPPCRTKLGPDCHIDHIMPLKLGGTNWPRNLQLLCPTCNARKGARDPIDHARILGMLL